jgi:hypothetical protein
MDAPRFFGPGNLAAGDVELPTADTGGAPGAQQERPAFAQRQFRGAARADVTPHRMQPAATAGIGEHAVGPLETTQAAVVTDGVVLAVADLAAGEHALDHGTHRVPLAGRHAVEQVGADHRRRRQPVELCQRRVDVDQRAIGLGERNQLVHRFDDRAVQAGSRVGCSSGSVGRRNGRRRQAVRSRGVVSSRVHRVAPIGTGVHQKCAAAPHRHRRHHFRAAAGRGALSRR